MSDNKNTTIETLHSAETKDDAIAYVKQHIKSAFGIEVTVTEKNGKYEALTNDGTCIATIEIGVAN